MSTSSYGARFAFIQISTEAGLNFYTEISVLNSNRGSNIGYNGICVDSGKFAFTRNNLTKNCCEFNSALGTHAAPGFVNFTLFDQNKAAKRIITQDSASVYRSIIVTNNTVSESDPEYPGMINYANGNILVENCYFANNNQGEDSLLGMNYANITLSNCLIVSDSSKIYSGVGTFSSDKPETPQMILDLFSTEHCPRHVYGFNTKLFSTTRLNPCSLFISNFTGKSKCHKPKVFPYNKSSKS
ncbi:hypothetical protein TVAG_480700 [Trichomonas vaginalis G3]|uniref:Right handed beta helix domain-containing protein n=1 Tax=Trichomonas vaginalis (strain ATCC PRA-98 / G3) TaxID=412133 RepID=A2FLH0_TRIV3|nr:pectin lyase-like family [Trichomonas vaginalis G3]EAX94253.1 hypothetical protein TVAG_480700 [Trichomonas vaginalis G3]KAI5484187.1 pectin lyase-like family [Trichomonas vaginalis G3]|eukprot:XP_001307183.1 hypothetical protein [Trichomonas vaginalis G3]